MPILATAARILRLYAIALWVGGLVFFIAVAQVAFTNLPSTHEAGLVVRHSLLTLHSMGMIEGWVYLVFTLLLIFLFGDRSRLRSVELLLIAVMMGLTAYSQHSIIPRMERDRVSLTRSYNAADVDATPKDAPARIEFDRLHNLSTEVESLVLLEGLVILALAAIPAKRSKG